MNQAIPQLKPTPAEELRFEVEKTATPVIRSKGAPAVCAEYERLYGAHGTRRPGHIIHYDFFTIGVFHEATDGASGKLGKIGKCAGRVAAH